MLEERQVGFFRDFTVPEADIGGGVIDPLDMYFWCVGLVGDEIVMGKCDDVASVEFIHTTDMDFIPLGLESGVFSIDGGY